MSMIDGLRNVLGINQDPEADSYVDDNEEDDIFLAVVRAVRQPQKKPTHAGNC